MRLPPVSGVASQASIAASHHHGLSSHRHAAAESKQQPSTPFAALLDTETAPPSPPPPPDHADRTDRADRADRSQPTAAASTGGDAQTDNSAKRGQDKPASDQPSIAQCAEGNPLPPAIEVSAPDAAAAS